MLNEIDLSRTDLNLLVFFEVVLAERNVGRAAAALHLTPSAVSHGLGRLRTLFNDPLFLRTPKGVVPSARAEELAPAIADVLARMRSVIATAAPFDPKTSKRRFTIGAPDGAALPLLPSLFSELERVAPGIDVTLVHALPQETLLQLDERTIDIALAPVAEIPARFVSKVLFDEEFVIAARAKHPFLKKPTLKNYCAAHHVLVSTTGDAHGHVDIALQAKGLSRRVAFVAPNFMVALASIGASDLVGALPRHFTEDHAKRYGVGWARAPLAVESVPIKAVFPRAATLDAGLMWMVALIERVSRR